MTQIHNPSLQQNTLVQTKPLRKNLRSVAPKLTRVAAYSLAFSGCLVAGAISNMVTSESDQDSLELSKWGEIPAGLANWLVPTIGILSLSLSGILTTLIDEPSHTKHLRAESDSNQDCHLKNPDQEDKFYDASDEFETILLRELPATVLTTALIGILTNYNAFTENRSITINILPIMISGLVSAGPITVAHLSHKYLPKKSANSVKNILSLVQAGVIGFILPSVGLSGLIRCLGIYSATQLFKYLVRNKPDQNAKLKEPILDIFVGVSVTYVGYYLGDKMINQMIKSFRTTKEPITERALSNFKSKIDKLPHFLSDFQTISDSFQRSTPLQFFTPSKSCVAMQHKKGECPTSLSLDSIENRDITPKDIRQLFETIAKYETFPRDDLSEILRKVGIDYAYIPEEVNTETLEVILGPLERINGGEMSDIYASKTMPNKLIRVQDILLEITHGFSRTVVHFTPEKIATAMASQNLLSFHKIAPKVHRVIEYANKYVMVMDKVDGITYETFELAEVPLLKRIRVIINLMKNLHKMHEMGIAHLDLHSNNVIVNPETGESRFIDFDCASYQHTTYAEKYMSYPPKEKINYRILQGLLGRMIFTTEAARILAIRHPEIGHSDDPDIVELVKIAKGFIGSYTCVEEIIRDLLNWGTLDITPEIIEKLETIYTSLSARLQT